MNIRVILISSKALWLLALTCLSPSVATAQGDSACPDVRVGQFGPFDYQKSGKYSKELAIVERVHFTPDVETLKHGSSGPIAADLNYTITAFPNHHRALDSASRYSIKLNRQFIPGMSCSVEGFFDRAVRFAPTDAQLHLAYGVHLYRWKKYDRAEREFLNAEKLAPDDGNVAYDLGLIYVELKDWDKAMKYAEKAYAKGYRLPGLKNMLVSAGKWHPSSAGGTEARSTQPEERTDKAIH